MGVSRISDKQHYENLKDCVEKRGGKLVSEKYLGSRIKLTIDCGKGHEWDSIPRNIIVLKSWCPFCAKTRTPGIEGMQELAQGQNLVCLNKFKKGEENTFQWKCLLCGDTFIRRLSHIRSRPGCSNCKARNLGERVCRLSFEAIFESKFPNTHMSWLINNNGNTLTLDGVNTDLKIAFEHQGEQHFKFKKHFHRKEGALEDIIRRDNLKIKLCEENGYKLAIVPDLICVGKIFSSIESGQSLIPIPEPILLACKNAGIILPDSVRSILLDLKKITGKESDQILESLKIHAKNGGFSIPDCLIYSMHDTPIKAICYKCEYEWNTTPTRIKVGKACPRCAGTLRLEIGWFKQEAERRGDVLLSTQYNGLSSFIEVKCGKCSHIRKVLAQSFRKGHGCKKCSDKEGAKKRLANQLRSRGQ